MKITRLGLASLVFSLGTTLAGAETLEGVWRLSGTPVELRFTPCDDAVCGLIETSARIQADPNAMDIYNKNPALRTRPLKGATMLDHLRWEGAVWKGRVYLPASGATYGVTVMWVDANTLRAQGCAAPLLCQTSTLLRKP
jgi:uncharacterized protein (DUF2147 family)